MVLLIGLVKFNDFPTIYCSSSLSALVIIGVEVLIFIIYGSREPFLEEYREIVCLVF